MAATSCSQESDAKNERDWSWLILLLGLKQPHRKEPFCFRRFKVGFRAFAPQKWGTWGFERSAFTPRVAVYCRTHPSSKWFWIGTQSVAQGWVRQCPATRGGSRVGPSPGPCPLIYVSESPTLLRFARHLHFPIVPRFARHLNSPSVPRFARHFLFHFFHFLIFLFFLWFFLFFILCLFYF